MPGQFESILDKLQTKLGKQTIRKASTIARPKPKFEVQQIKLFNEFAKRNPRADGGLLNGSSEEAAAAAFRKKVEELMDDGYDFGEAVREAMRQGYSKGGLTSKTQTKTFKYPKKFYNQKTGKVETVYSKKPPISNVGVVSDTMKAKSEVSFKKFEDRFGKKLLDKMAQEKYGKNFRELDKINELKFFKNQVNKYADFILENKRYPTTSEAYGIGLQQSGKKVSPFTDKVKSKIRKIYSSAEGGSSYISKKLAKEGINIESSTIRRFITDEVKAGRLKRITKFKSQEADPTLPKDRYNKIRKVTERDLRGYTVGRSKTKVLAPEGSNYKIVFKAARTPETSRVPAEYQGTQYYKTKKQADNALQGYKKFSKDFKKAGEAGRSFREIILRQVSDPNIESAIGRLKEGEDLATAHRLSYKQVGKLGQLYNIANLGVEAPSINSGAIRRFENKLDRLYEEQRNLIKTAKRSTNKGLPVPKNIQDKIDLNNRKISTVVDLTDRRVQGILIDTKTLKPTTYGIDYMKTYGMGLLKNKNVKDITDADLATIELNIKNQIKKENQLGAKTESLLRDRQKFIKNVDALAGPKGAQVAENLGILSIKPNLQRKQTTLPQTQTTKDKILKGAGKVLRGVGKVVKPVSVALGPYAVMSAASKADEMGIKLGLGDQAMAFYMGDPQAAIDMYRMRNDPEYAQQVRAANYARPLDEGTYDVMDESFTSYFDGGIVSALKGVK